MLYAGRIIKRTFINSKIKSSQPKGKDNSKGKSGQ